MLLNSACIPTAALNVDSWCWYFDYRTTCIKQMQPIEAKIYSYRTGKSFPPPPCGQVVEWLSSSSKSSFFNMPISMAIEYTRRKRPATIPQAFQTLKISHAENSTDLFVGSPFTGKAHVHACATSSPGA